MKRLRPGGSWSRIAGDDPDALVTLVEYDVAEGTADVHGRRPSDRCVGQVLGNELAGEICRMVNAARDQVGDR